MKEPGKKKLAALLALNTGGVKINLFSLHFVA